MPTVASTQGSTGLTLYPLLDQPPLLSRSLTSLVYQRLISDRITVRGSSQSVAGGAMRYQELESIFPNDNPDELAEGADFPYTDWSEAIKTAPVRGFGFGVRLTNYMLRRHQMDMVDRGMVKLSNQIVKYVDSIVMTALQDTTTYTAIQTQSASAAWGTITTDIIGDIAAAQQKLETKNNGYAGFEGATLVLNIAKRAALLNNTALRAALPRETDNGQIQSGMVAPFLGLKEILFTPAISSTVGLLLDPNIAATMAFETPDPSEGFFGRTLPVGPSPVYVKVEKVGEPQVHTAVWAAMWPAIAVVQPDAIVKISSM